MMSFPLLHMELDDVHLTHMMISRKVIGAIALLASSVLAYGGDIQGVNQVHLSLGEVRDTMVVTWSTPFAATARLRYSLLSDDTTSFDPIEVSGWSKRFVDNGTLHHTQFIHRAAMRHLKEKSKYYYQIYNGTDDWTHPFFFTSPGGRDHHPKVTVFGDFGITNPRAFPALMYEMQHDDIDAIVHVGDFAYNMYNDNATLGDRWFNFVEPVYSQQAVMTCVGNHEGMYDFLNYRERFTMPRWSESENLYFSWDSGSTHWISYSTEFYFVYEADDGWGHGGVDRNFGPYPDLAAKQLAFIEADLIAAHGNRENTPWIFAYGHRPFYCSDSDDDDCVTMNNQWRIDLEKLFFKYGVDIIFEAHQHSYERLWPTNNNQVVNSTTPGEPYTNPLAPVHIVAGAAGCEENLGLFDKGPLGEWSAIRISDYGYGHVTVVNETHLHWEQLQAESRETVDEIWIIRDRHLPHVWMEEDGESI